MLANTCNFEKMLLDDNLQKTTDICVVGLRGGTAQMPINIGYARGEDMNSRNESSSWCSETY